MKKFTLLIAMLCCAVGFSQNFSDLPASDVKTNSAETTVTKAKKATNHVLPTSQRASSSDIMSARSLANIAVKKQTKMLTSRNAVDNKNYDGPSSPAASAKDYVRTFKATLPNSPDASERIAGTTVPSGEVDAQSSLYNGVSYHNGSDNLLPVLAYESGPYFSVAGPPDESILENVTLGMNTLGGGMQIGADNRMAEDMILADDYDITSMDFFGYQTGEPTTPASINEINVQIWDGDPSDPASSVIYGDATTNVLTTAIWSDAYRLAEDDPGATNRAIQRITVETPGLSLAAGTYWVDWSMAGTGGSGPWQPPVVITGETMTGNAMQSLAGTWGAWLDTGTSSALGAPIQVYGDCTSCDPTPTCGSSIPNYANVSPTGDGVPAQTFADFPDFDSQAADDFMIPGGANASICQIDIIGTTTANGIPLDPTNAVEMIIYEDNAGLPGTVLYTESFLGTDVDPDGDGAFSLSPVGAPELMAGTKYWMGINVIMEFGVSGQWFWSSADDGNDDAFLWQNPGGGFGSCTTWDTSANCGVGGGLGPDLLMDLTFLEVDAAPTCGSSIPNYMNVSPTGDGVPAQTFADFPDFDSQAADDFMIPGAANASICQIDIIGTTTANGIPLDPTNAVEMIIYEDNAGLPGTVLYTESFLGTDVDPDGDGAFSLSPVGAPELMAGTKYWMGINVIMEFGVSGQWFWSSADDGNDDAFLWQNPGGGFGSCTTWDTSANCGVGGGLGPDLLMDITFLEAVAAPGCATGTYDDRAAFDTELASGTAFLEDFGGGPAAISACDGPINAAGNSCYPAGEILDGVEVTTSTPDNVDPMVFAPAGFSVNVDDIVGANQFTSFTIINFPNNDMNAFGFDLHSLVTGSPVDVRIFGTGGLIETVTLDVTSQGPLFFGYIADETIVSVELEDLTGANAELIAQLAFGSCSDGPILTEDECGGAIPVACDDVVVGDTSDNTDTGGNNDAPDEWYSFTGTGSPQVVTVSLCDGGTTYDSRLTVYDACDGNEIATNDDSCGLQSELSFFSDGTSTYYIAIEGFGAGDVGAFSMAITCVDPPVNDMCDGALDIVCGDTLAGTTLNATDDTAAAPDCDTTTSAPGVWYVYNDTSGLPTDILLSTCSTNTDYDTKISVYTGDCGAPPLTCVAGNDDSANCTDFQSEVEFQSDGNTTYYILVHGFGGAQGDFELSMTCTIVPPPNDDIADAIDLDEVGCPFTDTDVAMPGATTEAGNPTACNIDGANGVWYKITTTGDGFIRGTVASPAGVTAVNFFTAPNESSTEDELELVDWFENQCLPQDTARIPAVAGQTYYCFVVNSGGITDIVFDECETLGVEELEAYGFSFYPNPAEEVINLNSAELIESVEVYSILGQRVIVQDINATNSQINISALSQGAYLMKVSINGQVGTYKILKK